MSVTCVHEDGSLRTQADLHEEIYKTVKKYV